MLKEFLMIISINYLGILLSQSLNLPIPGNIIGFLFLFFLLYSKIIKEKQIERVSNFLLLNMTIFFLPPAIHLMSVQDKLEGKILKIICLMVITTFLTMGITGKIVQFLIEKKEKSHDKYSDK